MISDLAGEHVIVIIIIIIIYSSVPTFIVYSAVQKFLKIGN